MSVAIRTAWTCLKFSFCTPQHFLEIRKPHTAIRYNDRWNMPTISIWHGSAVNWMPSDHPQKASLQRTYKSHCNQVAPHLPAKLLLVGLKMILPTSHSYPTWRRCRCSSVKMDCIKPHDSALIHSILFFSDRKWEFKLAKIEWSLTIRRMI